MSGLIQMAQQFKTETDEDQDAQDYTLIMDCLSDMSVLSSQVLQDVIDEIQAELDTRPARDDLDFLKPDSSEESLSEIHRTENAVMDRQ